MNKKYTKTSYRLISAVLLVCMTLSVLLLSSCNSGEETADNTELVTVLRAIDDINIGGKFTGDRLETVTVRADAVPEGAYSSIEDLRNKFAADKIYAGDYILASKVVDKKPAGATEDDEEEIEIDPLKLGYVVITSYAEYVDKGDYSPAVKKAIEENPRSTIYFPDGIYNFSEPIVISADPTKSVSLRLSNLAVFKPLNWTDPNLPMIRVGVSENGESDAPLNDAYIKGSESVSIIGGVTIGRNSVVAAGSVVIRDVPPDTLVAGNPARVVRKITPADKNKYPRQA
jgi:hypothetical protein